MGQETPVVKPSSNNNLIKLDFLSQADAKDNRGHKMTTVKKSPLPEQFVSHCCKKGFTKHEREVKEGGIHKLNMIDCLWHK